ncbi:hypothetical protein Asulf_02144 [Archaeoglobus sulfaticallidus PM70-1]|uniref:Uncharacterized protein n=2 Tax=Archaeoglobus TaxID=2233 RepID=N0BEP4_9EURY|nr:hypothetical protein Asulf_02144 [Archaeoglobus sulfaticallidus PM70-1]
MGERVLTIHEFLVIKIELKRCISRLKGERDVEGKTFAEWLEKRDKKVGLTKSGYSRRKCVTCINF